MRGPISGAAGDHHVAGDLAAVAEHDLRSDEREGTDRHALAEPGAVLDDGGGVDLRGGVDLAAHESTSIADSSASATILPST